jgi:hypothetical protein
MPAGTQHRRARSVPGAAPCGDAIAGIGGITGVAFLPSGLLILWGIAIGVWLVVAAQRRVEPSVASAAA